jgi:phage gp29-like protein
MERKVYQQKLSGAENFVPGIAQTGKDIALFVQTLVNLLDVQINVGMSLPWCRQKQAFPSTADG